MSRRVSIDSLLQELERLTLVSNNIRNTIRRLEQQEQERGFDKPAENTAPRQVPSERRAIDRDGNIINIFDQVTFLTRGRFRSTQGVVTRFSKNLERVYARDGNGNEIPRAPRNVRVTNDVNY